MRGPDAVEVFPRLGLFSIVFLGIMGGPRSISWSKVSVLYVWYRMPRVDRNMILVIRKGST